MEFRTMYLPQLTQLFVSACFSIPCIFLGEGLLSHTIHIDSVSVQSNSTRVEHRTGVKMYTCFFLHIRCLAPPLPRIAPHFLRHLLAIHPFYPTAYLLISFHWYKFDYKCFLFLTFCRLLFSHARFVIKENTLTLISDNNGTFILDS